MIAEYGKRLWLLIGCTALVVLVGSSVGVTQTNTPSLEVTPISQDFGSVSVSQCSTLRLFTVKNIGGGTLSGTATTNAPFSIVSGASFSSLSANQTAQVALQFCPTSVGQFNGFVAFSSNGGSQVRTVSGTTSVTLTVTKNGTGSGTVTSNPSGINCGSTCQATFNFGTVVTLTATAASNSTFAAWSGGICSGTSACVITLNTTTSVMASFTRRSVIAGCYSGDVEGTSKDDSLQPCAELDVESATIRGDGNGDFDDGPNACSIAGCGNDKIIGTDGDDVIFGDDGLGGFVGTGNDWIRAGLGDDTVSGESGNDRIFGGDGYDFLQGGPGNDILLGEDGDDIIDGGLGNDVIDGGPGVDTLSGGGGNDTFIIRAGNLSAGEGTATIMCTQGSGESGKVLIRGDFKSRIAFGTYRNKASVIYIEDHSVNFGSPMLYEIMTGPGKCIIKRG